MCVKAWHLLAAPAVVLGASIGLVTHPGVVTFAASHVSTSFAPTAGVLLGVLVLMYVRAERRLRAQLLETQHLARHDVLTGLPNRILFREKASQALRLAERRRRRLAVILLDLDGFKEVNDTLGHRKGDELLVAVAERLRLHARSGDVVARLGGDEFAVVAEVSDGHEALRAARRINNDLEAPIVLDELPLHIEGSAGIALYPDHAADVETLLRKADVAMYAAKAAGGATLYDDGMDQYSPERLTLIHDLRIAIARRELMIEFQPLVDTQTLEPVSYEALVRWDHPDRGRLSPSEFLPLAEQSGLVHDLTSHVLREAVRHAAHWNRQRSEPITVAVNLSARDLHQPQLVALVAAAISEAGLAAEFLELEISENTIVGDPFRTGRVLGDLSSLGVSLAIDDFGAGTTSLQYLRRLPVQTLKIDRTLTAALDDRDDERSVHILSAIIMLAHRLRLRVVGEGVEHPAALEQLRDLGCDLVQGFLVGRPAAAPKPQSLAILDHRHTTRHAPATAASMQPV